jgi:hypothetical protein
VEGGFTLEEVWIAADEIGVSPEERTEIMRNLGRSAGQILEILLVHMGPDDAAMASAILRSGGYTALQITRALAQIAELQASQVAALLNTVGFPANEILDALVMEFRMATQDVATLLQGMGIQPSGGDR